MSCLPVIDTSVAVSAAPASGWHVTSTPPTLDGTAQSGHAGGHGDGSKTQSATANLTFKGLPRP